MTRYAEFHVTPISGCSQWLLIAARVVSAARHRDHITHDHSLHRLRERQRVIYKTAVRPCVHGVGAANLQELYVLLKVFEDNCGYGLHPLESGCIQLPGALSIDISRTAKFHFIGPSCGTVCHLRCMTTASPCPNTFKRNLKTYLFQQCLSDDWWTSSGAAVAYMCRLQATRPIHTRQLCMCALCMFGMGLRRIVDCSFNGPEINWGTEAHTEYKSWYNHR